MEVAESAAVAAASFVACALLTACQPASVSPLNRSRNVSSLHSVLVGALALQSWLAVEQAGLLRTEAVWTHRAAHLEWPVSITVGYIAFDCASGLVFGTLTPAMWLHHAIVLVCYLQGAVYRLAQPFHALFLVLELSTPFLNLHFQYFNKRRDWTRLANGAALWLTYLCARVFYNGYLTYAVLATSSAGVRGRNPVVWAVQVGMLLLLLGLNISWFAAITRGFVKALTGAEGGKMQPQAAQKPPRGGAGEAGAPAPADPPALAPPSSAGSSSSGAVARGGPGARPRRGKRD